MDRILDEAEMPQLYRTADAFVLPSRGEGWGRPFMEAMALGRPVVGTNWSGNTEFMHAENAYLIDYKLGPVPPEGLREVPFYEGLRWANPNPQHLSQLLREIYEDRTGARQRGQRARAEILEQYHPERVARQIAERVEGLLRRETRKPGNSETRKLGNSETRKLGPNFLISQFPNFPISDLYEQARQACEQGDVDKATRALEAILLQEPDHRGALFYLGQIFLAAGDPLAAREVLTKALQLPCDGLAADDPAASDALVHCGLGDCYAQLAQAYGER
jgi:tetratricopeptide (TPR) repeat protein